MCPAYQPPFQTELQNRNLRIYPFSAVFAAGFLSAGGSRTLAVPKLTLDTGVTTVAARAVESLENTQQLYDNPSGTALFWSRPMYVSVLMRFPSAANLINPSSSSGCGIMIGSAGAGLPPTFPASGLIEFRSDSSQLLWVLTTAKGDGSVRSDQFAVSGDVVATNGAYRLTVFYSPGGMVQALVNGVVVLTNTSAASLPASGSPEVAGAGVYVRAAISTGDQQIAEFSELTVETLGKV